MSFIMREDGFLITYEKHVFFNKTIKKEVLFTCPRDQWKFYRPSWKKFLSFPIDTKKVKSLTDHQKVTCQISPKWNVMIRESTGHI